MDLLKRIKMGKTHKQFGCREKIVLATVGAGAAGASAGSNEKTEPEWEVRLCKKFEELHRRHKDLRQAVKILNTPSPYEVLEEHSEEIAKEMLRLPSGWDAEVYWDGKKLSFSSPLSHNTYTEDPEQIYRISSFDDIPSEWEIEWCEKCEKYHNLNEDEETMEDEPLDHNTDAYDDLVDAVSETFKEELDRSIDPELEDEELQKAKVAAWDGVEKYVRPLVAKAEEELAREPSKIVLKREERGFHEGHPIYKFLAGKDTRITTMLRPDDTFESFGDVVIPKGETILHIVVEPSVKGVGLPVHQFFTVTGRIKNTICLTHITRAQYALLGGRVEDGD